jgi:rhomboid protease GluP
MLNNLKIKLKYIYLPFVFISMAFIIGYNFLYWVLFIQFDITFQYLDTVQIILPNVLAWIPVLIWLQKRLKILVLKSNSRTHFLFLQLAVFAIGIPACITQYYLEGKCGKCTALETIEQINDVPKSKYYTIKNYGLDQLHYSNYQTYYTSGKNNQNLELEFFIAIPIFATPIDTSSKDCKAYLSYKYQKTLNANNSDIKPEDRLALFVEESLKDYWQTDFTGFTYLEHLRPIQKNYYAAKNDSRYNSKNAVVFDAHYTTFESRADQVQSFLFGSMGIGFSLWLILLLFPKINDLNLKRLLKGQPLKHTP